MIAAAATLYFDAPIIDGEGSSLKRENYASTLSQWILELAKPAASPFPVESDYYAAAKSLDRFRLLANGWDGYEGHPSSSSSYEFALEALSLFQSLGIAAPEPLPYPSGTVGFSWESNGAYVSIDFDADGEFAYAAIRGGETAAGVWKRNGGIPNDLVAHLSAAAK